MHTRTPRAGRRLIITAAALLSIGLLSVCGPDAEGRPRATPFDGYGHALEARRLRAPWVVPGAELFIAFPHEVESIGGVLFHRDADGAWCLIRSAQFLPSGSVEIRDAEDAVAFLEFGHFADFSELDGAGLVLGREDAERLESESEFEFAECIVDLRETSGFLRDENAWTFEWSSLKGVGQDARIVHWRTTITRDAVISSRPVRVSPRLTRRLSRQFVPELDTAPR